MPLPAWKDVAVRVWNESWVDNIGLVAAGVAFYGFLALVPLLGILVLTYGLFTEPADGDRACDGRCSRILPPMWSRLIGAAADQRGSDRRRQTSGLGILLALRGRPLCRQQWRRRDHDRAQHRL